MTSTPYRSGHRVEHTHRALTADEDAVVGARREQWRANRARHEPHPALELWGVMAGCVGFGVFGAWRGDVPMLAIAGVTALFVIAMVALGARKRRERIAALRGPWHAPEGGWTIRETHIVARSIVGTASGDEDYTQWVLFEIPRGEWFFIEPYDLPEPRADLARENVHLTRLWPHGKYLSAESSGEPIPRHGASDGETGEEYATAVERGWVWRPFAEIGGDAEEDHEPAPQVANLDTQLVPESELPEWIRDVVKRA